MPKKKFIIPPDIDAELSPKARAFFVETINRMQAEIDNLKAQEQKYLDRITALESKAVKLTPKNSSLPPSTVHPHNSDAKKPKPPSKKSPRKTGGQPGRKRTTRPLVPTEECDKVTPVKPEKLSEMQRQTTRPRYGSHSPSGF